MAHVLGIGASPRRGGNSDIMLNHILEGASNAGAETKVVHLRDYKYQPCIGCERCREAKICTRFQDGMQLIYPSIMEARGLVLLSPTHNYNVTAWMKAFIDRLYCFYDYTEDRPRGWSSRLAGKDRKAVIACVGEQASAEEGTGLTLEAMRLPITALGYEVIGELPVLSVFDKAAVKENRQVLERAQSLGGELARAVSGTG